MRRRDRQFWLRCVRKEASSPRRTSPNSCEGRCATRDSLWRARRSPCRLNSDAPMPTAP
jgi:hypothetical protein